MKTFGNNLIGTKMIAHRGLSGLKPENTKEAFIAAGEKSYFGIETDVHITFDKKFVVIHDNTTGRVSKTDINIEKSNYETIRKIKLNGSNIFHKYTVPSLQEYIDICKKYSKKAVLELKNKFKVQDIEKLISEIKTLNYLENVIFISFDFENMILLREKLPDQPLQFLSMEFNEDVMQKLNKFSLDIDLYHTKVTAENVKKIHDNNHLINCWTVDSKKRAEELIALGVDFITTNILE